jgi:hypothetical protein
MNDYLQNILTVPPPLTHIYPQKGLRSLQYMYVCIYVYACMYIHICVYIFTYINTKNTHIHDCIYVRGYIYVWVYTNIITDIYLPQKEQ